MKTADELPFNGLIHRHAPQFKHFLHTTCCRKKALIVTAQKVCESEGKDHFSKLIVDTYSVSRL